MKTVIEMAKEAGAELAELPMMDAIVFSVDDRNWNSACLERFAELVRADERQQIIAKNAPEIERINAYIKTLEESVATQARSNT